MSSSSLGPFKVVNSNPSASPLEDDECSPAIRARDQRRLRVPVEALRANKIAAGSWVIVQNASKTEAETETEQKEHGQGGDKDGEGQGHVIAQVWPDIELDGDSIVLLSSNHLATLLSPSSVLLTPIDPVKENYKIAKTILVSQSADLATTLATNSGNAVGISKGSNVKGKGKERETTWSIAMIKEFLLEQKYITPRTRIILLSSSSSSSSSLASSSMTTPGYTIQSVVESNVIAAPKTLLTSARSSPPIVDVKPADDLTNQMDKLSVDQRTNERQSKKKRTVWIMNWKTEVRLVDPEESGGDQADSKVKGTGESKNKSATNDTHLSDVSDLPSYINLYPPGPLPTSSESITAYASLGGLSPQIAQVRSLLDLPLSRPDIYLKFGLKPPRGILLYGPPGTGKTHLARAIASSTEGCSCIVVNGPELSSAYHGETEQRLRAVFEEARKREPCIVVLDEVDAICPRRDGGESGEVEKRVVATLLTLMDGMADNAATSGDNNKNQQGNQQQPPPALGRVVVIAATNRPNAIDPALRRPGRFDREIEIGIPDAAARLEILVILTSKMPGNVSRDQLRSIAEKTHGYVGADLSSLVREAGSLAIHRWLQAGAEDQSEPSLTLEDLASSLSSIRPSAMREVFIETPTVKWSDIGGQSLVKQKLKECVEWPLTHADTFARLGVSAPKGILLYGPPGCSKTLTAKALATESGINFMAVKGPELLNKYVGESERGVREVFRKARAASPSIVFFDEIDALATARGESHDGPSAGVLTSLLNEMDGIEELSGVIVVAATNRPDVLDSALLRPGRLDRILYVGPPDLEARTDIFAIRFRTMAVEPGTDPKELALLTDGCSGAELVSICQDAALTAMNEDLEAPFVKKEHLINAAKSVRKRITWDMIRYYEQWRDQSGVRSA